MQEPLEAWDGVAPEWERHRRRLFDDTRVVSDRLIELLELHPGMTVLELAAGTGETGFEIAERVGPTGSVISSDFAPRMLEAAERGARARDLSNVEVRRMDAAAIELPDASVDAIVCRFGFMLMPDVPRAFAETRRVLRPGGALALATWGGPQHNFWIVSIGLALMQNGSPPPMAAPLGPGGLFSLSDPPRVALMLRDAGYADVSVEEVSFTFEFEDFEETWAMQTRVGGPIAKIFADMDDEKRAAVRETARGMYEEHRGPNGYALPARAVVARAR